MSFLSALSGTELMLLVLSVAFATLATVTGVTAFQLLAQNGRMMLRIEAVEAKLGGRAELAPAPPGLPVTTDAPAFSLPDLDGMPVALDTLRALGKPLLLFFSEPGCSACEALLPDVARWQRDHTDRLLVVPIGRGHVNVNKAKSLRHGLEHVLLQTDREVAEAYKVQGTPSAVLVKDGQIASPPPARTRFARSCLAPRCQSP